MPQGRWGYHRVVKSFGQRYLLSNGEGSMPVLATFPLPLVALNLALQEPTDQWGAA